MMGGTRGGNVPFPLDWGDGTYTFCLRIGEARLLQEACNAGPPTVLHRLVNQQYYVDDFRETIRLGLIGGGMSQAEALDKVKRFVDSRPWEESRLIAAAILSAAMGGVEDEPVGKAEGSPTEATHSPTENIASQSSMTRVVN